jgi:pyruvate formate lyase activating enzyme
MLDTGVPGGYTGAMTDSALVFNVQKFSIHDGPGIRTLVFFQGCPLACAWCANPESQTAEADLTVAAGGVEGGVGGSGGGGGGIATAALPEGGVALLRPKLYTIDALTAICLQDMPFYEESGGGVTLSGGEALVQHEAAAALLRRLRGEGVHTAIETSGYAGRSVFSAVIACADLVLFDIKHYDSKRHREGTGVPNDAIVANLESALLSQKEVLPRIPVIPRYNDAPADALGFSALLRGLGVKRAQLLPFHQAGEAKHAGLRKPYAYRGVPQLHSEDLHAYRQVFIDAGIDCFF